jgi:hypothetical protein
VVVVVVLEAGGGAELDVVERWVASSVVSECVANAITPPTASRTAAPTMKMIQVLRNGDQRTRRV